MNKHIEMLRNLLNDINGKQEAIIESLFSNDYLLNGISIHKIIEFLFNQHLIIRSGYYLHLTEEGRSLLKYLNTINKINLFEEFISFEKGEELQ